MDFQAAKMRYASMTGRGINNIIAGVLLWGALGLLGLILPETPFISSQWHKAIIYLLGAGLLFPLGLLVGHLMQLDTFAKGHPMAKLSGFVGGMQVLFIPIMLGAYFTSPEHVPWYLASLVGAHFLPFYWVYDSKAYLFGSISLVIVAAWGGFAMLQHSFVIVPFGVMLVLAGMAAHLRRANEQDAARFG